MANAYIVKGSEDGNIAVYTSKIKACKRAANYINQNDIVLNIDHGMYRSTYYGTHSSCEVEQFRIET